MKNGNAILIDGVDVENGISRSGGKTELYLEALSAFCEDGDERTGEIKKSLEAGDLPLYSIHVHGIKSAAAFIGAVELSVAAAALEEAAEKDDLTFVETHNTGFLHSLNILVGSIRPWLKTAKNESAVLDMESFKQELTGLKTALDSFDTAVMQNCIRNLIKLTEGSDLNNTVRKISDKILTGDYDEAVALIDDLL